MVGPRILTICGDGSSRSSDRPVDQILWLQPRVSRSPSLNTYVSKLLSVFFHSTLYLFTFFPRGYLVRYPGPAGNLLLKAIWLVNMSGFGGRFTISWFSPTARFAFVFLLSAVISGCWSPSNLSVSALPADIAI